MTAKESEQKHIGVAPGRLDILGGVADYSGSLVLETPIQATTTVQISTSNSDPKRAGWQFQSGPEQCFIPVPFPPLEDISPAWMDSKAIPHWVRYPLGCAVVLAKAKRLQLPDSLDIYIDSQVPQNMGVSSSAALEIATLRAFASWFGVDFEGTELARLGQLAENHMVGAPCGLMDQLSSAYGKVGELLPILCQPDQLQAPLMLPSNIQVAGWPSGVDHQVSGSPYAVARAATFAGFAWAKELAKERAKELAGETEQADWTYPVDIPLERFHELARSIPAEAQAAEFEHLDIQDPLSTYDPETLYPLRAALRFPIEEHARVQRIIDLMRGAEPSDEAWREIGQQLYASHGGYSSIGLGCPETNAMVDAIRELGPSQGFYGARVSGGGSGGTVVVLFDKAARETLEALVQSFAGSGPLIY